MSYEPPEYKKLKDEIWRLEKIKGFVDMAREFEHMKYRKTMSVTAVGKHCTFDPSEPPITVEVPDYLKTEIIDASIAWCIGQAKAIATIERKEFEIDACVKV